MAPNTCLNLNQTFSDFQNLKVLIIGDVMVDAYVWGKVERISPEAPVPILNVQRREKRLGGAANVALNIQALGATPLLCALVGDDLYGDNFISLLSENGISNRGIIKSAHRTTTVKERLIGGSQQILRVDAEDDSLLNQDESQAVMQMAEQLLEEADVIIFQDYDKGMLDEQRIGKIITLANKKGIPTVVDPKKRNFPHYKKATLFKPNLKELKEGLRHHNFPWPEQISSELFEPFIQKASARLRQLLEAENILITLSEKGVFIDGVYQGMEERHFMPAFVRQISDVSGAGDTVVSIAALCLALQVPPATLAALSNLGGGLVCESVGVVPVNKQKLIEEAAKYF